MSGSIPGMDGNRRDLTLRIRRALCSALLLLLPLAGACTHIREHKLPAFEAATALPPRCTGAPIWAVQDQPANLPAFVPYLVLLGDFHGGSVRQHKAMLRREAIARDFAPDFLLYEAKGTAYAGSVGQHVGFGIVTSTPVYRPQGSAYCCRLMPISLGFGWNATAQMVIAVTDDARAQSGIQEGDTVVTIDGFAVTPPTQGQSPVLAHLLTLKPGDTVDVVWIRPGTGRMSGQVTVGQPAPMPDYQIP